MGSAAYSQNAASPGNLTAKYIIQTADATLTNAQVLGALATGLVKNTTTTGALSIAVGGTDYLVPGGVSGGQTLKGDTASGGNLTLMSTAHATKGSILFGGSAYDEVNDRIGIRRPAPDCMMAMGLTSLGGASLWGTTAQFIQIGTDTSVRGGLTVGQGTSNNVSFYWTPNATASSATAYIETTGFNNPLKINARNIFLHPDSPAFCNVMVGTGTDGQAAKLTLVKAATHTSGTERAVHLSGSFAPTSGTGVYNHVEHAYTINQTGGANGATTGLLVTATETAVGGTHNLFDFKVGATSMLTLTAGGSLIMNSAALATNATSGFLRIRVMAGAPTGAAADGSIVLDTTNLKFWGRMGGAWKGVVLA